MVCSYTIMLDIYTDTQEAAKTINVLHIVLAAELLYGSVL